jgi:hypothetical protein
LKGAKLLPEKKGRYKWPEHLATNGDRRKPIARRDTEEIQQHLKNLKRKEVLPLLRMTKQSVCFVGHSASDFAGSALALPACLMPQAFEGPRELPKHAPLRYGQTLAVLQNQKHHLLGG